MSENELEPEIGGFFRSNLLAVRKAILQQEFRKFAALESNAERVAFILRYPEAHQLPLEVEEPMIKNNENAIRLKDVGNKFFGRGKFTKALETYSNAALLASPTGRSTCLIIMFHLIMFVINTFTINATALVQLFCFIILMIIILINYLADNYLRLISNI